MEQALQATDTRSRLVPAILWGSWALLFAAGIWFVWRFGRNLPRTDDWINIRYAAGVLTPSWHILWEFFNQHRLPLQRAVYIGLVGAFDADVRAGMYANVVLFAGSAALLMCAARHLVGRFRMTDLIFPIVLLGFGQGAHWTFCFELHFSLAIFLVCLAVFLVARAGKPATPAYLALGFALMLLLPMDGTTCLIVAGPLVMWLVYVSFTHGEAQRSRRANIAIGIAGLLAWTALALAYINGYSGDRPEFPGIAQTALAMVAFSSTAWGHGGGEHWRVVGPLTSLLLLGGLTLCLWQGWRSRERRALWLGLATIIVGHLLLMSTIAVARGRTAEGVTPARYASLLFPAVAAVYLAGSIGASRWGSALRWSMAAIALATAGLGYAPALADASALAHRSDQFLAEVNEGVPLEALATRYTDLLFPVNYMGSHRYLKVMADGKFGPFGHGGPGPRRIQDGELTPLPESAMRFTGRVGFANEEGYLRFAENKTELTINCPPGTTGVRVIYSLVTDKGGNSRPKAKLICSPPDSAAPPRVLTFRFAQEKQAKLDVFPLEPISKLRLHLTEGTAKINVHEVLAYGAKTTAEEPR